MWHRLRLLLAAVLLGQGCSGEAVVRHRTTTTIVHGRPAAEVWVWRDCDRGSQQVVVRSAAGTDITTQTGPPCHAYAEPPPAPSGETRAQIRQRMLDRMRGDWSR